MARLIKVDRNGSKHYEGMVTCDRCGGSGLYIWIVRNNVPVPTIVDNGICHKCLGEGKVLGKWIERTPEYEAKLEERRKERYAKAEAEREAKRIAEREAKAQESLTRLGFNQEGITFLFLGDTFSMKDTIKELGGKYDSSLGWHIDHKVEGFDFIEANIREVGVQNQWGTYDIITSKSEWDAKKRKATTSDAGFFGSEGDKVKVEVELVRSCTYEVRFAKGMWGTTTNYIHCMKDSEGHVFVWKTSSPLEKVVDDEYKHIAQGEHFIIKGTIKEHNEYRGEKQTVLTRCRVA